MKNQARSEDTATGYHMGPGVDLASAIGAGVRKLVHPKLRKKAAAEAPAGSGRSRRSGQELGVTRSPLEAGLTGGMTLLLGGGDRHRRR